VSTALARPLRIGPLLVRNRLYRAPVLEGAGSGPDAAGVYAEAFGRNARAGVGLIIQGNSCVTADGRSSPGMTLVHRREATLALAEATAAVHRWGARIVLQIGHAGLYAMEGWHAAYRGPPVVAVSKPPLYVRPALRGVPVKVLSTQDVRDLVEAFGRTAAWAREAAYDGVQIASSNAKLVHQFLSPFYNRRTDEFGGSLRNRARILEALADSIRRQAGDDFPLLVKIPLGEDAPPLSSRTSFADGIELCRLAEAFGYHAITPVGLSVFPHASLCRGGNAGAVMVDETHAIRDRYEEALDGSRVKMAILRWGYRRAAKQYPFAPVWNRPYFTAARRAVSIPVFAVGGIRTLAECEQILHRGEADMIGIGRPFYAEPDLPERLLERGHALCESSNRCLPPQMLGMKAACYNPNVHRKRAAERYAEPPAGPA
jgi:2,4-dienoyl-CoA reductase-like NADH-dependent reductase (Old Yellow Enzyme family)